MKILVAGDGHSELHEAPVCAALKDLGHEVNEFFWHVYFRQTKPLLSLSDRWRDVTHRFQNKFVVGPAVHRLNADLLRTVQRLRPDLLFVYRGTHITRRTLRAIRSTSPATLLVGYNNDDPFAIHHPRWLWRHFLDSLPFYDLMLAYRHHNVEDFLKAGAKRVRLLRSWFVPQRNRPTVLSVEDQARFCCDVVFVGHYEPDQRVEYLEEVVREGFSLKLYGPGYDWDPILAKSPWLMHLRPVQLVWGEEYNKALSGAKIALCFLSKLNRDTYTRRCFEIPATKTLLLSEYSEDLAMLYREGVEADFFRARQELTAKLRLYIKDEDKRRAVACAGYQRVIADRHDIASRMVDMLNWTAEIASVERHACV